MKLISNLKLNLKLMRNIYSFCWYYEYSNGIYNSCGKLREECKEL